MIDPIDRQAAIDALKVAYWDDNIQSAKDDPCIVDAMTDWAIRQIKELPSAQPTQKNYSNSLDALDCVSRQAAIDALYHVDEYNGRSVEAIRNLPSAQPEIIRCKDCNNASKCHREVIMRSRGGGNIYCHLEFCSNEERREDA